MDKAEFQKKFAELQSEGRSKLEEISKKHDGELTLTDEYFKKMDKVREEYNKKFFELDKQYKN